MNKALNGYVVDTHIFLWLINSPEKINQQLMRVLEFSSGKIFITSLSFLEISIKYNLGKLQLNGLLPSDLPNIAKQFGFDVLEIDSDIMATFYQLPKTSDHKDPFDRLIIWKCITDNYVLLSQDSKFKQYQAYGLSLL